MGSRIGYFGLGINLRTETPSQDALRQAVDEILNNVAYKENITKLSKEISSYNANLKTATYLAELLSEIN